MSRKITIMVAGIATAAALALSGCSSDEPTTTSTQSSQVASQSASTETSPSAEASETKGTSSTAASGKPTKDDVVAGIEKYYESLGLPAGSAGKFANCLAGEMFDKSKDQTLKALADGDPTKLDLSDAQLFADANGKCTAAI